MSKIYSSEVKYIKKPNSIIKKIGIFFIVVTVIICLFFGGIGIANLLSSNGLYWFKNNKIIIKGFDYYVINFGEFDNEKDALECAIWTASVGGAAYVYKENKFVVVGQIYLTSEDANSVINGFNEDLTYDANIGKYMTKNLTINIKNIKDSDKRQIDNDTKAIFKIMKNILNISEKLDKNIISNVSASSEINLLKSEIKVATLNLRSINSTYNDEILNQLIRYLIKVEDSLDVCINKLLASENYSNVIKYCACELYFNYYDFCKNFV